MIDEAVSMKGELHCVLTGPDGEVKQEWTQPNLVTTAGKEWAASRLQGTSAAVISHMAVGTGTTEPAANQTALVTESARVSATPTLSGAQITYAATIPPGTATGTLTEAGLFNAASVGTMPARTKFSGSGVSKGALDTLTINWTLTVG